MEAILEIEKIKAYYHRLIHTPGYIKRLKECTNSVQREEILIYARDIHREAVLRLIDDNETPYNWPPCSLVMGTIVLPDGTKLEGFTYRDKLKYWIVTSGTVINILEGTKKKISNKKLPPLTDCFIDKKYFFELLKNPRISDFFTIQKNGYYQWNRTKSSLGGLAIRLLNTGKLINDIRTNQDLAKVFCPFFNVDFDLKEEKAFQSNRAETGYFNFIK